MLQMVKRHGISPERCFAFRPIRVANFVDHPGQVQEVQLPAYWVARSRIIDPVEYKKYTDRVPGIIAKYGGKVLARGGRFRIMEGPDKFHRFVVIEFATLEQGVACFTSKEYEEAAAFRRNGAGEVETIIVESGDATPQ
jgi:uncharacterized protein (DUF1330 family)